MLEVQAGYKTTGVAEAVEAALAALVATVLSVLAALMEPLA